MAYLPRRAHPRFLDGDCPEMVVAIYDNGGKTFDRYTVIYRNVYTSHRGEYVMYRGMSTDPTSPQGFGQMGEMMAWEVAPYRHRVWRDICKWSDLPAAVQSVVKNDCKEES